MKKTVALVLVLSLLLSISIITGTVEGKIANPSKINYYKGDENYLSLQMEFYGGYITGYVVEQTFLLGKVSDSIKAFELGAKLGELSARALGMMAKLTETFGYDAAKLLKTFNLGKLALESWDINALEGLTRIAESSDGVKWISSFSEDVAKRISTNVDNIAKDLASTCSLSSNPCKDAAEKAVTDLLNSKIGKKAVVEWSEEEQKGLGKIFEKYDENFVDNLASRYGGEETVKITSKGIKRNVLDINKENPEKLAQYIRGVKKIDIAYDPLEDTSKQQLLKIMKNPHGPTQIVDNGKVLESIDEVAVLKKGSEAELWGWEHMVGRNHNNEIQAALGLSNNDAAVKEVMSEVIEYGTPNRISGEAIEVTKTVTRDGKSHDILVVISDRPVNVGSIQDGYPI
jgi:hypothetical protein